MSDRRVLVLFDIDGTLLHAHGAGRRAVLAAMGRVVAEPERFDPFSRVRFDGKTDPQIIAELLAAAGHPTPCDPALLDGLCAAYVERLDHEFTAARATATPLPGVGPLLDALEADARVLLGLLTGNLARGAELKLTGAGLAPGRFRVGAYGSDSAVRAELPAIAAARAAGHLGYVPAGPDVVIIGDTPHDITCGRGIGARAVAVATGSYSVEELQAHGPHAVFPDLTATAAVCAAILGHA